MAGLLGRARHVGEAKALRLLNDSEDIGEQLELDRARMTEEIPKLRKAIADHTAARNRVESQRDALKTQAATLHEQASEALAHGNEELAQQALASKAELDAQIAEVDQTCQQLSETAADLDEKLNRAMVDVQRMGVQTHVLQASAVAAQVQIDIAGTVSGLNSGRDPMRRLQEMVEDQEARSAAINELASKGVLPGFGFGDDIEYALRSASAAG